jgi:hypothetical protein
MRSVPAEPPRVEVSFEAIRRRGEAAWLVTWRIRDRGGTGLTVVEAWHPHARFHSSRLRRALRVPPRASASFELPARIDAGPGNPIENAFLILRAHRGRELWRVLARFSVTVDDSGTPLPDVERVDVHPA